MTNFNVNVTKSVDNLPALLKKIYLATLANGFVVDVGIVSTEVDRADLSAMFPGDKSWNRPSKYNNAELAYIHENGLGDNPKRPFMEPALRESQVKVYRILSEAARKHFKNRRNALYWGLIESGKIVSEAMRQRILNGISPSLSMDYLIYKRGNQDSPPLMDTEQMFNAIGYELRKK